MSGPFKELKGYLKDEVTFHQKVLLAAMDKGVSESIDRVYEAGKLTNEERKKLKVFFKTALVVKLLEKLTKAAIISEEREFVKKIRLSEKRKRVEHFIRDVRDVIFLLGELCDDGKSYSEDSLQEEKYFPIIRKIFTFFYNADSINLNNVIGSVADNINPQIREGTIRTEDDFALAVTNYLELNATLLMNRDFEMKKCDFNDKEIDIYHLYFFMLYFYGEVENFLKLVSKKSFRVSMTDVLNLKSLKIENQVEGIELDKDVIASLTQALKKYTNNHGMLVKFLQGELIDAKIEFTGTEAQLQDIFKRLYMHNKLKTQKKKLGYLIANSFLIQPANISYPKEINPDQFTKGLSRQGARTCKNPFPEIVNFLCDTASKSK